MRAGYNLGLDREASETREQNRRENYVIRHDGKRKTREKEREREEAETTE
jgi:hypothetical protein